MLYLSYPSSTDTWTLSPFVFILSYFYFWFYKTSGASDNFHIYLFSTDQKQFLSFHYWYLIKHMHCHQALYKIHLSSNSFHLTTTAALTFNRPRWSCSLTVTTSYLPKMLSCTLIHSAFFAPVLSATTNLDSCCNIIYLFCFFYNF